LFVADELDSEEVTDGIRVVNGAPTQLAKHKGSPKKLKTETRRAADLSRRPPASTFTTLSQVSIHDRTIGFNVISGVRRVQASYPSQSTSPITEEERQSLAIDNLELMGGNFSILPIKTYVVSCIKTLPVKTIRGVRNPLHEKGRYETEWLSTRRAINARPKPKTENKLDIRAWYVNSRDQLGGIKVPHGLAETMFDMLSEWENDANSVPASIREDLSKTLLAHDIWIHWIIRHLIQGSRIGGSTARAKHLRLYLLALFRNGCHLWFQIPDNGIEHDKAEMLATLSDRILQCYPPFAGPHKGEEGLIKFAQHLRRHVYIDSTEAPVLGLWAERVLSGLAFNSAAKKRDTHNAPKVPEIYFDEGASFRFDLIELFADFIDEQSPCCRE
jgi:hypothetical protein